MRNAQTFTPPVLSLRSPFSLFLRPPSIYLNFENLPYLFLGVMVLPEIFDDGKQAGGRPREGRPHNPRPRLRRRGCPEAFRAFCEASSGSCEMDAPTSMPTFTPKRSNRHRRLKRRRYTSALVYEAVVLRTTPCKFVRHARYRLAMYKKDTKQPFRNKRKRKGNLVTNN